jgi:hypothetical protein
MGQGGREVGGGRRRLGEDKGGYCFFCFGFVTNRRYICIRIYHHFTHFIKTS